MKKQVNIITLILLSISVFSCTFNNKHKNIRSVNINVDLKQICKLDDYFNIENLTYLETNDTCVMGNISKLVVKNNKFYFESGKSIYTFDKKGKFLWKISDSGKSLHRYSEITDFYVNEKSGAVEILDMSSQRIIIYDDNIYKNAFNLGFYATSFQKLTENNYLFYCSSSNKGIGNRFVYYSRDKNKILKKAIPINPKQEMFLNIIDKTNFVSYTKDTTLCLFGFNDVIYSYKMGRTFEPYLNINYGNKKVSKDFLDEPYQDVADFMHKVWKSNLASQIIGLFITKKYILFGFFQDRNVYNVLINRLNNENIVINKYSSENLLSGYTFAADYANPLSVDSVGNLYFKIEPSDISKYIDSLKKANIHLHGILSSVGKEVNQFENPLILQLKSKD